MNSSDRAKKVQNRLFREIAWRDHQQEEEKKKAEKMSSGKELARQVSTAMSNNSSTGSSSSAALGAGLMGLSGNNNSSFLDQSSISFTPAALGGSSNMGRSGNNNSFMGMMTRNELAANGAGGLMMSNNSSAGLAGSSSSTAMGAGLMSTRSGPDSLMGMSGPDSLSSFSSSTMPSFSTSMGMMSNNSSAGMAGSSSAAMGAGLMSSNFASGSSNTMPPMPAAAPSFVPPSSMAMSLTNDTSRSFDMNNVLNIKAEKAKATVPTKRRYNTKVSSEPHLNTGRTHSEESKLVMREVHDKKVSNGSHHGLAQNSGKRHPMTDAQTLMNDRHVTDVEQSTYMSPGGTEHLAVLLKCTDRDLSKHRGGLVDKEQLGLYANDFGIYGMERCDEDKDELIQKEGGIRKTFLRTKKFYDPSGRFGTARVGEMTRTEATKKVSRDRPSQTKRDRKRKKEKKRKAYDSDE